MLRYTFGLADAANLIDAAVQKVLAQGFATGDIDRPGAKRVGTVGMGDAVVAAL
jgi:3-isopropylmalate dehydrogenase